MTKMIVGALTVVVAAERSAHRVNGAFRQHQAPEGRGGETIVVGLQLVELQRNTAGKVWVGGNPRWWCPKLSVIAFRRLAAEDHWAMSRTWNLR
jgi:hypothetical protein